MGRETLTAQCAFTALATLSAQLFARPILLHHFRSTRYRYERTLGITSNLVFSEWERIFANPMATAAAIDRVVHHSVTLEFDVPSYRTNAAQQRGQAKEVNRQN